MPNFKLVPFPSSILPAITITGKIARTDNQLSIHYEAGGELEDIALPAPSDSVSRKHDLWKTTCFEFFLAVQGQPQYWEFNMSPSGNWNVYFMDVYRQVNMREETAFTQLPFEFSVAKNSMYLNLSVNVTPIVKPDHDLEIGIAAIIQTKAGDESYWALAHPGPQADFHLREGFTLKA